MIEITDIATTPRAVARALTAAGLTPRRAEAHGPSGFSLLLLDPKTRECVGTVIVSQAHHDDADWLHASIAFADRDPTYDELKALKAGAFGDRREAYQVFPPATDHVNIHSHALHLWGRADGERLLPAFGRGGTI